VRAGRGFGDADEGELTKTRGDASTQTSARRANDFNLNLDPFDFDGTASDLFIKLPEG
jgi:hypothetical protein